MSAKKSNALDVQILDREFRVACPDDEKAELLEAVGYLDKKMREIRDAGKVASTERIAIMAALNIATSYLQQSLAEVLTWVTISVECNPCRQLLTKLWQIRISCSNQSRVVPAVFVRLIIL